MIEDMMQRQISDHAEKLREMVMEMLHKEHTERMHKAMMENNFAQPFKTVSDDLSEMETNFVMNEEVTAFELGLTGDWKFRLLLRLRYKHIENPSAHERKHMNLSADLNKMYRAIVDAIRRLVHGIDSDVYMGFVHKVQIKVDRLANLSEEHTKMIGFDILPWLSYELTAEPVNEERDMEDIPVEECMEEFVRECVEPLGAGPISRRQAFDDYKIFCNYRMKSSVRTQSEFNRLFVRFVQEIHGLRLKESKGYKGNTNIRTWTGADYHAEYERRS